MRTMLENAPTLESVSHRAVLIDGMESLRAGGDESEIRVSGDIPDVGVVADEVLGTVLRNHLVNAACHTDAIVSTVTVSATDEGDPVTSPRRPA